MIDALSPRDVAGLLAAWRDREVRADLRAGQICATVRNASGGLNGLPAAPWHFFSSLDVLRPPPQTPEQYDQALRDWF